MRVSDRARSLAAPDMRWICFNLDFKRLGVGISESETNTRTGNYWFMTGNELYQVT